MARCGQESYGLVEQIMLQQTQVVTIVSYFNQFIEFGLKLKALRLLAFVNGPDWILRAR